MAIGSCASYQYISYPFCPRDCLGGFSEIYRDPRQSHEAGPEEQGSTAAGIHTSAEKGKSFPPCGKNGVVKWIPESARAGKHASSASAMETSRLSGPAAPRARRFPKLDKGCCPAGNSPPRGDSLVVGRTPISHQRFSGGSFLGRGMVLQPSVRKVLEAHPSRER